MNIRYIFKNFILKKSTSWKRLIPSKEEIDVVIPTVKKDLEILPLCLEGVRRCVKNRIRNIYIVAPYQEEIIDFCTKHKVIYLDEKDIIGITPKDINLIINGVDRSGWIFQQLLKLSGNIGTAKYYLTIDADHVLIKEHVFLDKNNKTVFYMSHERHQEYYDNMKRLCGIKRTSIFSYVAHKMLFDKGKVKELHILIEKKNPGKDWKRAIIDSVTRKDISGFSEFELYGNFCRSGIKRPWLQKALVYNREYTYDELADRENKYLSITFPDDIKPKKE